jgi:hypothetical protein
MPGGMDIPPKKEHLEMTSCQMELTITFSI